MVRSRSEGIYGPISVTEEASWNWSCCTDPYLALRQVDLL